MNSGWFLVFCAVGICAYIWAIIWTGQTPKKKATKSPSGIALVGEGLDHVRIEYGSGAGRQHKTRFFPAERHLASREMEVRPAGIGSKAKPTPRRATIWDRLEDRTRGSFLRYLFQATHRANMDRATEGLGTIGTSPPPPEPAPTSEAPRHSGADFPQIGKAILDRYDGEVEVFPYRKAVLQLSKVKATAMRRGGEEHLSKIECHMDVENHTKQQFRKCRVRLAAINSHRLGDDKFLRIGRLRGEDTETEFAVKPEHGKSRINFMKRDLDDVVSNPPFLLCLNDRDFPLSDGKEYRFIFALECEYEHPTYATVRFYVPEREKVEIELLSQSLDMPDD